jgi:hypothetical protein
MSGSIRNSELLSMTTQPAAAAMGAYFFVASEPMAKIAMSQPAQSKFSIFWTFSILSVSPYSISMPWLRDDASTATSSAGNSRSARMLTTSRPTLPVAPATTIR